MIRVLTMIAVAGFVLCVACLAAAIAIGGPDAISRSSWGLASSGFDGFYGWNGRHWGWHGNHRHMADAGDSGPHTQRTIAWSGGDRLAVDLPADIRYVQADGPGSVTVSGAADIVDHVVVKNGDLRLDGFTRHWWPRKLTIVVQAPGVSHFDLSGANNLAIEGYKQDQLDLDISGAAEVRASGEAKDVKLEISGTANVDLADLKAKSADVKISGAGGATIAPTEAANLDISGMADVHLLTQPPKLDTHISGAARIRQSGGATATAPAPAPPSPPVSGKKT